MPHCNIMQSVGPHAEVLVCHPLLAPSLLQGRGPWPHCWPSRALTVWPPPLSLPTPTHLITGFLPICQNQIQGLFKNFQGPYEGYIRGTKLNQTGTFISVYKQVQFTFDNLTPASINQKLELSEKFTKCINSCHWNNVIGWLHWFWKSLVRSLRLRNSNSSTFKDLQTQIQGLSRTMSVFKDFPGLENLEKKFKDFQGPARAL